MFNIKEQSMFSQTFTDENAFRQSHFSAKFRTSHYSNKLSNQSGVDSLIEQSPLRQLSPRIDEQKSNKKPRLQRKEFNLVPKTYTDYAAKLDRLKASTTYLPPILFEAHSSLSPTESVKA